MSDIQSASDTRDLFRRALIATVSRSLDLHRRVPALLAFRGYTQPDFDLVAVLCAAVACKKAGAGKQSFRRPQQAGVEWPADKPTRTATEIIIDFDLYDLLEPV